MGRAINFLMEKNMFETVDPKVDFPKLDKEIFQWWEDEGLPKKYRERNQASVKGIHL